MRADLVQAAPPSLSSYRAPPGPVPAFVSLDSLGSPNVLFVAADGLKVLLQGGETRCAGYISNPLRKLRVALFNSLVF
jgi:hypothetical protein